MSNAEGTEEQLTLHYIDTGSVPKLARCHMRFCGRHGRDFWLGSFAGSHDELARKLPTLQVGPFWAVAVFSHCYAATSLTPDSDAAALTEVIGLGQRLRKPQRRVSGPGLVYLLVQEQGFSKLYKYNMAKKLLPADRAHAGVRPAEPKRSATKPAEESKETDAAAPAQKVPRLQALTMVSDPLADPAGKSLKQKPKQRARTGGEAEGEPSLHQRQVEVIKKRLATILPQLPFDQLRTSLVLTKLEECMQKRKGRFDGFRADIEHIIIAYVTENAEAAKAAAKATERAEDAVCKPEIKEQESSHGVVTLPEAQPEEAVKSELQDTRRKRRRTDGATKETRRGSAVRRFIMASRMRKKRPHAQVLPVVSEGAAPAHSQEPSRAGHLAQPVQAIAWEEDAILEKVVAASPERVELSDAEGEATTREGDDAEPVEVDIWGFQMAMDQFREAAGGMGEPGDALAVLKMLLTSKPSAELLADGSWEAVLSAHQRTNPNSRISRFAKTLCDRWKLLQQPVLAKQELFKQAMAALAKLSKMQEPGENSAPSSKGDGIVLIDD